LKKVLSNSVAHFFIDSLILEFSFLSSLYILVVGPLTLYVLLIDSYKITLIASGWRPTMTRAQLLVTTKSSKRNVLVAYLEIQRKCHRTIFIFIQKKPN
jgi:hypothetical protein